MSEYKMNGFTIRYVGDTWKVIYETSSISEVRFIGTLDECEYFCSLDNLCYEPWMRQYVRNMKDLRVWIAGA